MSRTCETCGVKCCTCRENEQPQGTAAAERGVECSEPVVGVGHRTMTFVEAQAAAISRLRAEVRELRAERDATTRYAAVHLRLNALADSGDQGGEEPRLRAEAEELWSQMAEPNRKAVRELGVALGVARARAELLSRERERLRTEVERLGAGWESAAHWQKIAEAERQRADEAAARGREAAQVLASQFREAVDLGKEALTAGRLHADRAEVLFRALTEAVRVLKWGHQEMRGRPPQYWLDALELVSRTLAECASTAGTDEETGTG